MHGLRGVSGRGSLESPGGAAATPGEESEVEGCKKGAGSDRDEVWGAEGPGGAAEGGLWKGLGQP